MYDIPNQFDAIGDAIAEALMHPAFLTVAGGQPVLVRAGFEAPYLATDANGSAVNQSQPYASGLATAFADAREGDVLEIRGTRWVLREDPQSYGRGNLCRMKLAPARESSLRTPPHP